MTHGGPLLHPSGPTSRLRGVRSPYAVGGHGVQSEFLVSERIYDSNVAWHAPIAWHDLLPAECAIASNPHKVACVSRAQGT